MIQPQATITFSHLRWNFVYQRPQQLLSRLSTRRPVYFVEEPLRDTGEAWLERLHPEPGVTVLRPHTPEAEPGFSEAQIRLIRPLLESWIAQEKIADYVLWFYTPMALPLAQGLEPLAVVYDSMDELSAFLNAPRQLLELEEQLFQMADVVFTGGPSLHRAKKDRHHNVHCFSSSVDAKHFGLARTAPDAPEQAALPHPRLGFFGVIDERLDVPLVDAIARSHPEWQISMVGPVVKIDPRSLPAHANLHYFGQRKYEELPSFLAGWDVCLLPFARNEATRFISPTKTLEYMAAERPIVSTPITDVAEPYGDIVYLGSSPEEFIAGCESGLAAGAAERERRARKMRAVLSKTSWDSTAEAMDALILQAIEKRQPRASAARARRRGEGQPVVVVGAGPTGLSAAYHLGDDALLIEQNNRTGGWCRSIVDNGFTFDYAGHIMFSADPYVHKLYELLLGDNVHWQDREAWVYSKNVYTRYPFQGSLHGLPPQVIRECVMGAIEARFGPLKRRGAAGGAGTNGHAKKNGGNGVSKACASESVEDCCGDGILEATARLAQLDAVERPAEPRNFEEFIYKVWGAGIAKHFAIPYNRKLWAVPLDEMETSWLGGRVPLPDLEEMIAGALEPAPKPMGPNARFGYPLRGGFQALMDGFLPFVGKRLRLNTRVTAVSPRWQTIYLSDGTETRYEHLISTMPLPVLVRLLGDEAPAAVKAAAAGLRHVSVRCVNLGIGRERLTDKHWIYYPEDTVFHRIFVQGNASPHCNAPGGFGLTCEITYSPHKPLPAEGDALIELCIRDCHRVGLFGPGDPVWATNQTDLPHAYVVYDHNRKQNVETIRNWLASRNILLAGRYSEWEYYNSDHAFIAGKKAAELVRELERRRELVAGDAVANASELFSFEDLA